MVSVPLIFELHGLELYPGAETVIGFAENSAELGNEGESVEEIEREFIEKALREKDNDDLTKNTNTDYSIAFPARELAVKQPTNKNNMILTNDQIKIHNWLVSLNENDLNSILMGGMRNENIIQAIALVIYHIEKQKTKEPILIIVPARFRSSFVWKEEFTKWAPWLAVDYIYKNPLNLRYENAPTFDVLITTIKYYFEVQEIYEKINWSYLILDVGETVMSSHVQVMEAINARYSASRRLVFVEKLENRLSPLWALVNFIVPSIFKSTSKFEEWFNKPFDKTDLKVALNEEETTLVISHLQKVLRPLIQRRLVAEVKDNVAVPVVEPIKRRKRLRLSQIRGNI